MDKIYIRDLAVRCIIGIYPRERRAKQKVLINLTLEGDFRKAASSDDIADAINYKTLKKSVIDLVEASTFNLIEKLADQIAATCLRVTAVTSVTVTLDKPGALSRARSVAVEITRRRRTRS